MLLTLFPILCTLNSQVNVAYSPLINIFLHNLFLPYVRFFNIYAQKEIGLQKVSAPRSFFFICQIGKRIHGF